MRASIAQVRLAARGLSRARVLSVAAVTCLALGIGATVAIYGAVHSVLLESLPFPESERLATIFRTTPQFNTGPFSPANFRDLARDNASFEGIAAITSGVGLLHGLDEPIRVSLRRTSGNLFDVLRAPVVAGRPLRPSDEDLGRPPVALASAELWRDRFGADPDVVGRNVTLDGVTHEIVGVLPDGFEVPHGGQLHRGDLWLPFRFTPEEAALRESNSLSVLGRLKDGVSLEAADAELRARMDAVVEEHPELRGEQLRVVSLQNEAVRTVRQPLLLLLGSVGLVLLIAVANTASLLLARGIGRRSELAVRAVLGAGQRDLIRPILDECLLLAGLGGGLGLGLAWLGTRAIRTLVPASLPQLADLQIGMPVLGFALLTSLSVAVLCALGPVWQARRGDPQDALRAGGRGGTGGRHHRWLRGLVVFEVGLSVVLLLGSGLVLRGFSELVGRDPGFDPDPLLKLTVNVDPDRYPEDGVAESFLLPALERIRGVPGVLEAGSLNLIPYDSWGNNFNVRYEGQPETDRTRLPLVEARVISPSGFDAIGHRLIRGRLFDDDDGPGDEFVAVANEALVARDFPNEDPIGRRLHQGPDGFVTIIGVVSDIRNVGPSRDPAPELYFNHLQSRRGSTYIPLIVRVSGEPTTFAPAVTRAIREVDPSAAVSGVASMRDVMSRSVARARFYMLLLAVFAGVAMALSAAGLYGVMSYAVAQRTREIGIRSALGSTPGTTIALVLRQGLVLVAAGLVLGLLATVPLSSLLGSLLYGISRMDWITWATIPILLALVGAVAILVPARRASGIDPMIAMRHD